jgi:hypothetical protein
MVNIGRQEKYINCFLLWFFMEYRSISAKLPVNELTLFKNYCEKKGVTPASLIRDLILKEMEITVPHTVAGKNKISYDKKIDGFIWSIELDNKEKIDVLKNISPEFIEDLVEIMKTGLGQRNSFIQKKRKDSVSVPSDILRGDK